MSRLAENNRVLFIEAQISLLHPLRYKFLIGKCLDFMKGVRRLKENLLLYSPPPILPFGNYSKWLNKTNQSLLAIAIKRQIKKLNFADPILWIYTPLSSELVGAFGEKLVVYHCIDNHAAEKDIKVRRRTTEFFEYRLLRRSHLVFTSSRRLYSEKKETNENAYFVPGAVPEYFLPPSQPSLPVISRALKDLEAIRPPRIGFVGIVDERLDAELVDYLAQARPDWSFVIIGFVYPFRAKNITLLKNRGNIFFLGMKPREELPGYIKGLDVCLIPYRVNEFTAGILPLKLFEYLAIGKPIVATALPELKDYREVIKIAETKERFLAAIAESLDEVASDGGGTSSKRIALAMDNTWEKRVKYISEIIIKSLSGKASEEVARRC
jgi:glycosyltransferase involved in cell wall biosynthesis